MTEVKSISTARLAGTTVYVLAWPTLLFALAGDLQWIEGWLFTGWLVGLYGVITGWMYAKDPGLLAVRYRLLPFIW